MHDAKEGRKEPNDREITYQVGWKRGTIRFPDNKRQPTFAEKALWRPLPEFPVRWLPALLWMVPAASFALTYALVTALMRAH